MRPKNPGLPKGDSLGWRTQGVSLPASTIRHLAPIRCCRRIIGGIRAVDSPVRHFRPPARSLSACGTVRISALAITFFAGVIDHAELPFVII